MKLEFGDYIWKNVGVIKMVDDEWLVQNRKITDYVRNTIMKTKEIIPEHWNTTLNNRAQISSLGSYYRNTPEEIEHALLNTSYVEFEHPNINPNCKGFITYGLYGFSGLVGLSKFRQTTVKLEANKGGFLSCVMEISPYSQALFETFWALKSEPTILIIGDYNAGGGYVDNEKVVFTFHAGDPVTPSIIIGEERTLTGEEAISMGFDYAKLRIKEEEE